MNTTPWKRHDLTALRQHLIEELERLETGVAVADIDAAVERTLHRRRRAQAALARCDAGTFGLCCHCELDIELERLQLDPSTPFCADCEVEIGTRRRVE